MKNAKLPKVTIVDLKHRSNFHNLLIRDRAKTEGQKLCILSDPLKIAIQETIDNKQQVILLLNRRGYASFALCSNCSVVVKCDSCSVSLTYHKFQNALKCHQCGFTKNISKTCASCERETVRPLGLGTERVFQEVEENFKEARVEKLDRDSVQSSNDVKNILQRMQNKEIDILIGTQMIAKGHDFPSVALVGVVFADTALNMPDFRADERTFQLITQVAGRAGRSDHEGKVIIQTLNKDHPAIKLASKHDTKTFAFQEMNIRQQCMQPPFVRAVIVRIVGTDHSEVNRLSFLVKSIAERFIAHHQLNGRLTVLGPAPCPLERLRGKFRFQLYLRSKNAKILQTILSSLRYNLELNKEFRKTRALLQIDMDPQSCL